MFKIHNRSFSQDPSVVFSPFLDYIQQPPIASEKPLSLGKRLWTFYSSSIQFLIPLLPSLLSYKEAGSSIFILPYNLLKFLVLVFHLFLTLAVLFTLTFSLHLRPHTPPYRISGGVQPMDLPFFNVLYHINHSSIRDLDITGYTISEWCTPINLNSILFHSNLFLSQRGNVIGVKFTS